MATTDQASAVQAFLEGAGGDWAAWLGMAREPQGLRVRTFQPGARAVSLLRLPGEVPVAALTPVEGGVFEAVLPAADPFPYRYAVDRGEGPRVVEDPYSFQGALGELDHHLLGEGLHRAGHTRLGAHPRVLEGVEGVAFAVWAPEARRVSVVGDFNGWDGRRHPLRPHPNGVWDLFVPGVEPGARYKFEVLGRHGLEPLKADPFAFQAEPPPRSASVVHGLPDFPWTDQAWMAARRACRPHRAPMSVYEVHLGSWRRREDGGFLSYRELARELVPYAVDLGFTHLELLPVMEHPFYGSWGYQPLSLFAPTSRHGAPEDFAAFVDACHRAGLGVILDWVPAHFPEDGHGLARFDGSHLYEHADPRQGRHRDWNTLVYNYGRTEVQAFLLASAEHWLDRYHIDALRVDAVASMLYADYSRREGDWIPNRHGGRENLEAADFLRRANIEVHGRHPGVFTVAEESTAWPGVTRPVDHGGLGFSFKWNMGWMHDTLAYLARAPLFRIHHHDEITFSMLYAGAEAFVLPLSHDEVVHGKGSLLSKMPGSRGERFANLRLLLAWQHAHGGKKLLFMGGEFGQAREWDHDASLDWALLQDGAHRGVQALVRDLNRLHRELQALHEGDCEPWGFRWIDCGDRSHQVLAIHRQGEDPGEIVVAAHNFSGLVHRGYRLGPPAPGRWIEALNTDSRLYGGANEGNLGAVQAEPVPFHGQPWSAVLTLPALGAVFLRPAP